MGDEWMDGCIGGWMVDGWMVDRWMVDGWVVMIDGWMDGWLAEQTGEIRLRYGNRSQLLDMGKVLGLIINILQLKIGSASIINGS